MSNEVDSSEVDSGKVGRGTPQRRAAPADRRGGLVPDDGTLLRRVAAGDRAAFETLYHRFYRPLFGYLLKLTGRPEAVEELVDDTLLVVWRRAASFSGRSRPSTWIFGIAYHKALKSLEKQQRQQSHRGESDAEPVDPEAPDRVWARRELSGLVAEALALLPAEQRAVVVLTYHHGLSYPEIAEIAGCPVGTVKTRMFHARRKLARLLPTVGVHAAEAPDRAVESEGGEA